jgi:hypothetical protein
MLEVSENLWPFKAVFSSGNNQSRTGPNLTNMVDGPISLQILWPKTSGQRACHDARSTDQVEVQVFSDEKPHTSRNFANISK